MDEFTRADAWAVNQAALNAKDEAEERKERMPSSSEALQRHADQLEIARDKILDRLPPEQSAAYPRRK